MNGSFAWTALCLRAQSSQLLNDMCPEKIATENKREIPFFYFLWIQWVNQRLAVAELDKVRRSVNRGTPHGSDVWISRVVQTQGC